MVAHASTYRYATLVNLRAALSRIVVDRFLTSGERDRYRASRHDHWLAGRLLAKHLVLDRLRIHAGVAGTPCQVDIDSGGTRAGQHRPRLSFCNKPIDWSLSISHTTSAVLVALSAERGVTVGADLVEYADRGRGFLNMWFADDERRWLDAVEGPRQLSAAWAMKEATYKACNRGEPFRPREIKIRCINESRFVCYYRGASHAHPNSVHFWNVDNHVAVIVTNDRNIGQNPLNLFTCGT